MKKSHTNLRGSKAVPKTAFKSFGKIPKKDIIFGEGGWGGGTFVTNLFPIGCVQRYKLPQVAWFKIP